jgi:urease accessory protein
MDTADTRIRPATGTTETGRRESAEVIIRAARAGRRTVIEELRGVEPWRPRIVLGRSPATTVALVSTRALLIAGDDVRLSVTVGRGALLELIELGAMLVHHARGGAEAKVGITLRIEPGGTLVWLAAPIIASAGCRARRRTVADIAEGGRLLLGESVAFGRAREAAGALSARTRITLAGVPLLDETLETAEPETLGSSVVAGPHRIVHSLVLAGACDEVPPDGTLRCHGTGMVWRSFEAGGAAADRVAARWRGLILADHETAGAAATAYSCG